MPPQASIPAIKVDVMDHPVPIPDQALSGRWSPVMSAGSICGAFRPRQSPGLLVSAGQSTDGVPLVNVFTGGTLQPSSGSGRAFLARPWNTNAVTASTRPAEKITVPSTNTCGGIPTLTAP